MNLIFN